MGLHFLGSLGITLMQPPVFICIARQLMAHHVQLPSLNTRRAHPRCPRKCCFMHMHPLRRDWTQYLWAPHDVHIIIVIICFGEITLALAPAITKLPDLCGREMQREHPSCKRVVKIYFSRLINLLPAIVSLPGHTPGSFSFTSECKHTPHRAAQMTFPLLK